MKKIKKQIKEYYNTHLKDIIYFICILTFACLAYLFIQDKEESTIEQQAEKEVNAASEFSKQISFKSVSTNRLNDMTLQNFLRELAGEDYTFLIELFAENKLDQNQYQMSEIEIMEYAAEVGSKIKNQMNLKSAFVIENEAISDNENRYTVELNLQYDLEEVKKIINLTIINGEIITDINDLY